jgi:hypothetical protein
MIRIDTSFLDVFEITDHNRHEGSRNFARFPGLGTLPV